MKRFLLTLAALCAFWSANVSVALVWIQPSRFATAGSGAPYSDNFDSYSDGADLDADANWVSLAGSWAVWKPASAGRAHSASSGDHLIRHIGTLNADHYVEVELYCATAGGGVSSTGPAVRCQSGSNSGYFLHLYDGTLYLNKANSGTFATVASITKGYVSGHKLRLEVSGTGSATRLTVKEDTGSGWVVVSGMNAADPGGTYIDGGFAGLGGANSGTGSAAETWTAGNL